MRTFTDSELDFICMHARVEMCPMSMHACYGCSREKPLKKKYKSLRT